MVASRSDPSKRAEVEPPEVGPGGSAESPSSVRIFFNRQFQAVRTDHGQDGPGAGAKVLGSGRYLRHTVALESDLRRGLVKAKRDASLASKAKRDASLTTGKRDVALAAQVTQRFEIGGICGFNFEILTKLSLSCSLTLATARSSE